MKPKKKKDGSPRLKDGLKSLEGKSIEPSLTQNQKKSIAES